MKNKYKLTKLEKETIITFNEAENHAELYTCNKPIMKRLEKLCCERPEIFRFIREDCISKEYHFPKSCIKINKPRKLSDAQKKALTQRLKANLVQNSQ